VSALPTRNYFLLLRAINMDTEKAKTPEAVTSEGNTRNSKKNTPNFPELSSKSHLLQRETKPLLED
jgi:hypothetical protein